MLNQLCGVVDTLKNGGSVELEKITDVIFLDCLDKLKNLDGEAYIKGAVEVFKVIDQVSYQKL